MKEKLFYEIALTFIAFFMWSWTFYLAIYLYQNGNTYWGIFVGVGTLHAVIHNTIKWYHRDKK